MTNAEIEEPDFNANRPEGPSFHHLFLSDELQTLFTRYHFYGIDRDSAVLGGVLADFWDEGDHAEVCIVNTIACDSKPEAYIMYLHTDGSFVAIHTKGGVARWCVPGAPLLNDEEVQDTMNDLEFTEFSEAVSVNHTPEAYDRVCLAWSHAFLKK